RLEDSRYGGREMGPLGGLQSQLLSTGIRETVELGFSAELGRAPFGFDPPPFFHSVEGGVERALLDLNRIAGRFLEPSGDRIAVARAQAQGLEHERVQCSMETVLRERRHRIT